MDKKCVKHTCLRVSAIFACTAIIVACSEPLPDQPTNSSTDQDDALGNRAVNVSDANINQVFGGGFAPSASGSSATLTGFLGNTGGFGLNASIAGIIGNVGGFGFEGFGTFASFFAGNLPIAPPAGVLPPPGNGGIPPGLGGGFGTIPAPIAGGNIPPGFTPPGVGGVGFGAIPPGIGGVNGPPGGNPFATTAIYESNNLSVNLIDYNLQNLYTPLSNLDLDLTFVAPKINNNISFTPLAITETITNCTGGGTMTRTVDDVAPPGPSTGDTRTTTFNNCVRGLNGATTLNGSRGFSTDLAQGMPFVDPSWSTKTTMFRNNLVSENTNNGTSRTSNGNTSTEIIVDAGGSIQQIATGNGSTARTNINGQSSSNYNFSLDFSWDTIANTYNWNINIDVNSNSIEQQGTVLSTLTPVTGSSGQGPTSGQLSVTKSSNGTTTNIVTLTAQLDGSVLVETDSNADGIVDTSVIEANWSSVFFNLFNSQI